MEASRSGGPVRPPARRNPRCTLTSGALRHAAVAALLVLIPALVGGVSSATAAPSPNVFLGYSYTKAGEASLHGWNLAGGYPLGRSLEVVVDLAGHYGSFAQADLSQLTFMAGGRWSWRRSRITPFVQALVGGVRSTTKLSAAGSSISDSDTDWGPALGGGVSYRLGKRWMAQARLDLLVLRAEGAWESDPRLSLGVVYRLRD